MNDGSNTTTLRGRARVLFGQGLKPMAMAERTTLDQRCARLLIQCGYSKLQMPDGATVDLASLA